MARPTMAASASGVLKPRARAELASAGRAVTLNTPPLPFTSLRFASRLQSATSSPNTRMSRIAPHLFAQRGVDQVHHGHRLAVKLRLGSRTASRSGRPSPNRDAAAPIRRAGGSSCSASLRGLVHFLVDLVRDALQHAARSSTPSSIRNCGKRQHRVARRFRFALGRASCRGVHRRRASANRAGCTCACTSAGPCPSRHYCRRFLHGSVATPGNRCRPPPAGTGRESPRPASRCCRPAVWHSTGTEMA